MSTLPLVLSCALAISNGSGDSKKHTASPPSAPVQRVLQHASAPVTHPAQTARPPAPRPISLEPGHHEHEHHRRASFTGAWVPIRVTSGIDELQTRGPGALTAVENPGPVDAVVTGNWRLVLPVITAAEDGYGRVDTFRESSELGRLNIGTSGTFKWQVPGRTQSAGALTEVTASDAPSDEHFWSLEGNGLTLVIAPGSDGSLLLYDASSNAFYARAVRD